MIARKREAIEYQYNKNERNISQIKSDLPFVSVIIPTHNEQSVIKRRLENILQSIYPKNRIEIIVVDSGSIDKTGTIINEYFSETVVLLSEKTRAGKAHAINLALRKCKGEIIIITDAPTLFDRHTINQLVNSLNDPVVGGVSALYIVSNAEENQLTSSEQSFWALKDKIRILESRCSSTSWLSGEACAFRKKVINKLDEDTLADDSNVALHIISKGYKAIVNRNCYFSEKSPSEFGEYFNVKSRRILGGLKETLRFRHFLFNSKYGTFGTIIFPYRFFTQFVNPIMSYIIIALFINSIFEISAYVGIYGLASVLIFILAIGLVFRTKITAYIYLQIALTFALVMLLTKKNNVLWTQSRSSRT